MPVVLDFKNLTGSWAQSSRAADRRLPASKPRRRLGGRRTCLGAAPACGCSLFVVSLCRACPAPPTHSWGVRTPGPDPEYKAGPVIGAWAACGRVTGERPAPAEDVSGSGPKNSPSWGRGEPSAGTGAGGLSRCARLGPRQVRAGRCLGAAGLVCNRRKPLGASSPTNGAGVGGWGERVGNIPGAPAIANRASSNSIQGLVQVFLKIEASEVAVVPDC